MINHQHERSSCQWLLFVWLLNLGMVWNPANLQLVSEVRAISWLCFLWLCSWLTFTGVVKIVRGWHSQKYTLEIILVHVAAVMIKMIEHLKYKWKSPMATILSLTHAHLHEHTHTVSLRFFFFFAQIPSLYAKVFLGSAIPGQQQWGKRVRR